MGAAGAAGAGQQPSADESYLRSSDSGSRLSDLSDVDSDAGEQQPGGSAGVAGATADATRAGAHTRAAATAGAAGVNGRVQQSRSGWGAQVQAQAEPVAASPSARLLAPAAAAGGAGGRGSARRVANVAASLMSSVLSEGRSSGEEAHAAGGTASALSSSGGAGGSRWAQHREPLGTGDGSGRAAVAVAPAGSATRQPVLLASLPAAHHRHGTSGGSFTGSSNADAPSRSSGGELQAQAGVRARRRPGSARRVGTGLRSAELGRVLAGHASHTAGAGASNLLSIEESHARGAETDTDDDDDAGSGSGGLGGRWSGRHRGGDARGGRAAAVAPAADPQPQADASGSRLAVSTGLPAPTPPPPTVVAPVTAGTGAVLAGPRVLVPAGPTLAALSSDEGSSTTNSSLSDL
jgi:hypothetical protein